MAARAMTAKMTSTGQTEQRKQAARRMRKAASANSAAVSRILLSKLLCSNHHTPSSGFCPVSGVAAFLPSCTLSL